MAVDWSPLFVARKAVEKKFGTLWQLPLRRRYSDVLQEAAREVSQAECRVLEVGAGDRALKAKIGQWWPKAVYSSCDIDASHPHEFSDYTEITGEYDVICSFEMIEHVPLDLARNIVTRCYEHCAPGGVIVVSTPNTFYPPAYLRDATHITPFCYDELGALLTLAGFEVTGVYRLHHDAFFKKWIKRTVAYPLYRLLGIDFAHQIIVTGTRPIG